MAAACQTWKTSTIWQGGACPQICVPPDDPICPSYACPALTPCATGSTLTTPPMTPATTTERVETDSAACSVTEYIYRRCVICGCLGCPKCVATRATPTPTPV
ncbi:8571d2e1-4c83-46f3-b4ad-0e1c5ca197d1 [Thermothielavioides terrestris]|uniref:8571d2e1-4c83-46f3-b4ad-0e1c5ca197d1 n=1 Tax=Thermothielavioides terrestris TaxID=2587410 RepID=A0A446BDA9_9PEZI|nr:8571d2e1-4c83-46f3-b4ad-0e1c5ca197d1 [Thermothielavioides terrestris]